MEEADVWKERKRAGEVMMGENREGDNVRGECRVTERDSERERERSLERSSSERRQRRKATYSV